MMNMKEEEKEEETRKCKSNERSLRRRTDRI
jgi:hypothetical protein